MTPNPPVTATALAERLADGTLTSGQLVEDCLDAIAAHGDPAVFITLLPEHARAAARASDARRAAGRAKGAFDGIPVAWKDLVDIAGTPTTAGSKTRADTPPAAVSAEVVTACDAAGLIPLGKTNLSEFAYSGLGLNPHFGTPANPCSGPDPRVPGGSSSGSAVAVAARLVPLAVGTDTAGSVRVPAGFCGICGFKSSQSRYSKAGVFPLSTSLDSLGSFAHCVDDLIALDAMMRGVEPPAVQPAAPPVIPPATNISVEPLDILIPETLVFDAVAPDVLDRFDAAVGRLSAQGHSIVRAPFPIFLEVTDLFARYGTLTVAEAATLHAELLASPAAADMDQRVRQRMLTARSFSAQDYITLQWARARLQDTVRRELGARLLLFPTTPFTAPSIAALEASASHFADTNLLALRNTMPGNFLGMPGVSLPIGRDSAGLPIGALLSAANGRDDHLLRAASQLEALMRG